VLKRVLKLEHLPFTFPLEPKPGTRKPKRLSMEVLWGWNQHLKGELVLRFQTNFYQRVPIQWGIWVFLTFTKLLKPITSITETFTTSDVLEELYEIFPVLQKVADLIKLKSQVKKNEKHRTLLERTQRGHQIHLPSKRC